jgi:tetratricopeptide (TPR) repeat protein
MAGAAAKRIIGKLRPYLEDSRMVSARIPRRTDTLSMAFFAPGKRLQRPVAAAPVALVVLGALLYAGALQNGFTTWDDDIYVTRNPLIRDVSWSGALRLFTGFSNCNYHPVTYLTYWLEHALVGETPWLYHLDSVLLHLVASVLAFGLARRWLKDEAAAFLSALLFLAHPVRVESVAWVAERKDVLCAVFYLGSLIAYSDYLAKEAKGRYLVALGLFLLAILSKAMAVSLPGVLALLLLWRGASARRRWLGLLPFFALGAFFAWIGILAQASDGAVTALHGGSWLNHFLTIPKALFFYAGKLIFPLRLSPRYLLEPATGALDGQSLLGIALMMACITMAWRSFHRGRVAFLGIGFFALAWAPVSGLIPSSTLVADRYLYLPAFGLFLLLGMAVAREGKKGPGLKPPLARPAAACFCLLFPACLILTPLRVDVWRDGGALWHDALRENPRNPFAFNQLSLFYLDKGRYGEAAAAALEAARLGLRSPEQLFGLCMAYRGLGDGEKELATAKGILAGAPKFVPAWLVVLRRLREDGQAGQARKLLDELMVELPEEPGLLAARGSLERSEGNHEEALRFYLRSIELRPGEPEALLGASVALALLGDGGRALDLAQGTLAMPGGMLPPGGREELKALVQAVEKTGREDWIRRAKALERQEKAGRDNQDSGD